MKITPELHAAFLGCATVAALIFSGIILARNPKSTPARLHAVYGGLAAWWFFCMAMLATSVDPQQIELWSRLLHLGLGMLPGVTFHLNVATAGVGHRHRRGIFVHYALSVAVTLFCVSWPALLDTPWRYSWGSYVAYSSWGVILPAFLIFTVAEVAMVHRRAMLSAEPGTAYREKTKAFYRGNVVASLALVDFLPAFGVAVYPFGFVVMTVMHAATLFGSIRYRLIEVTAEFAADPILEALPDGVLVIDSQGLIRLANGAVAETLGCDGRTFIDRHVSDAIEDPGLRQAFTVPLTSPPPAREICLQGDPDRPRFVRLSDACVRDQAGEPVARVWVLHDLTDQRFAEAEKDKLEGWVRHGQKLETLGVMAGGIAHDFNNILTAIMGSADLARRTLGGDLSVDKQLRTITNASERAAELTRQMLTFAGKRPTFRTAVDLNALSLEIVELMQSAISKKAKLELDLADQLPRVLADESQMSQVILNLVTNASDALGQNAGSISIRTGVLEDDDRQAGLSNEPGKSRSDRPSEQFEPTSLGVFLEVTDTGSGMDDATKERMFDPFFTTRFSGRGLGLATVMGIVESHGGRIRVDSEPGVGTRFTVALPAAVADEAPEKTVEDRLSSWTGSGVALLVDDEPAVRDTARDMLSHCGFEVAEAADGREAVAVFGERKDQVRVVLLDLTMPEMDGKEAFAAIRTLSPNVPVVFMSGYTETSVSDLVSDHRTGFLNKPFRSHELLSQLRRVMSEGESIH